MARDEPPDVIVADILMPEMSGYEFVQELRADPVLAPTPVVFCTATSGVEEVRRRAEACGVSHILIKPCGPQEILPRGRRRSRFEYGTGPADRRLV